MLDEHALSVAGLGRLLTARARELGLEQRQVAAQAGVSSSVMHRWATGERSPSLASLQKVTPVLRLEVVVDVAGVVRGRRVDP